MDLNVILNNARSGDPNIRNQAEMQLNQAAEQHYGGFALALCTQLATEGKNEYDRQLAGLYLKNLIHAEDKEIVEAKQQKWFQCDEGTKNQIRAGILQAMLSAVPLVSHTAAQVIAAFGSVDVERGEWTSLLSTILQYVAAPEVNLVTKVSALECLGYMCDEMDPSKLEKNVVDLILNTIVGGMQPDRPNEMKKAAVTAMCNSLEFTSKNFEIDVERDAIMQVLCASTQSPDPSVRIKAFECIATVGDLYYTHLPPYMETIFNLTANAIKNDTQEVGLQAIEFWSTVSDVESEIVDTLEDDERTNDIIYLRIVEQACNVIVPILLETLTKQDDDNDDDDIWNISKGGATCLDIIAQTIRDKIVELVIPFISANVSSTNWRLKEAAIMAFGSIMDGPSQAVLTPIVASALPVLMTCLKDQSRIVRGTTSWTLGRMCDFHAGAISAELLIPLFSALLEALDDPCPAVVTQACFAVHNLSGNCSQKPDEPTNALSPFLPRMIEKLLEVSVRSESEVNNLRSTAYVTINNMIMSSAQDMRATVAQVLNEGLIRLEQSFHLNMDSQEKMTLQGHLCGLICVCIQKLPAQDVMTVSDRTMTLLLQVFRVPRSVAHQDAFMVVGYIADKLETQFSRYADAFVPFLITGLRSVEEHELITALVGVVGDLCRALHKEVLKYCDEIVKCMLDLLQSSVLNRVAKPHVLSTFSDIAMAIEGGFERYAAVVMGLLQNAGQITVANDDEEMIEYLSNLQECILDAYTGIVQGLSGEDKQDALLPYMEGVANFIHRCATNPNRSSAVIRSSIGLIGDLGQTYGARMLPLASQAFVAQLIQSGMEDEEIESIARWTHEIVTKLKQQGGRR